MNEPRPTASRLRLFIAIPLPEPLRHELKTLQSELRARLPGDAVRWTPPEQIHLTLKFLGGTPADRVGELTANLHRACAPFAPFPLRAERIGFFPERGHPRVIWTAVRDMDRRLALIQTAVARTCAGFGDSKDEKEFAGHLTLGRVEKLPRALAEMPGTLEREMAARVLGEWKVSRVDLMRSELSPQGARHFRVAEIALGAGND